MVSFLPRSTFGCTLVLVVGGFPWNSLYLRDCVGASLSEGFNDWGGRGYDDFVPGEVTKIASSEDETIWSPTWSASLPRIHRI